MVYSKSSYCYHSAYEKKREESASKQFKNEQEENLFSETSNIASSSYADCTASMEQMKSQIEFLTKKLDYLLSAVNSASSLVNMSIPVKNEKYLNNTLTLNLKGETPHFVSFLESKKLTNKESVYIGVLNTEYFAHSHSIGSVSTAYNNNYLEENVNQSVAAVNSSLDTTNNAKNNLDKQTIKTCDVYRTSKASVYHAEGLLNHVYASPWYSN